MGINIKDIGFKVIQADTKPAPWADEYRPHWRLTLTYQGRRSTFDFWNNMENKTPDKLETLDMLISDALSGLMDIDEFAREFGYDKPSEVIRVHKGCRATYDKLTRLLNCGEAELIDLGNLIRETQSS